MARRDRYAVDSVGVSEALKLGTTSVPCSPLDRDTQAGYRPVILLCWNCGASAGLDAGAVEASEHVRDADVAAEPAGVGSESNATAWSDLRWVAAGSAGRSRRQVL